MVTGICIQLVTSLPCASVRMAGGTLKIWRTVKDDTHQKYHFSGWMLKNKTKEGPTQLLPIV